MIGSIDRKIAVSEVGRCNCGGTSRFFAYEPGTGYISVDTLEPGRGYWTKSAQPDTLFEQRWEKVLDIQDATITVHPTDPNVLFVAVWSIFMERDGCVLKSIDRGLSWDTVARGIDAKRVVIDSTNPSIGYVNLGHVNDGIPGILKTTDAGDTWFRSDAGIYVDWESLVTSITIDPTDSRTLYTQTGGSGAAGSTSPLTRGRTGIVPVRCSTPTASA
jgi:hypothetical protein